MRRYKFNADGSVNWCEHGLWVRYQDYREEIDRLKEKAERCSKYNSEIIEYLDENIDWAVKYKELREELEHTKESMDGCNCLEMARGRLGDYPHMVMDPWWVCPKHGYKKR